LSFHAPHLASVEDLRQWADQRYDARADFPDLVRRLVKGTNDSLLNIQMGGGVGVDHGGYDGQVTARMKSPFVPDGHSVWELGVGADFQAKATRDYKKRTNDSLGVDKKVTTFVFVTPRYWPDREKWLSRRRAAREWKDVIILHSDDIFSAMEDVPAVHIAFSETIGKQARGVLTLAAWWERYTTAPGGLLSTELVLEGRSVQAQQLMKILSEQPNAHLWIEGQSVEDVMAFVAATLTEAAARGSADDLERALVVFEPGAMLNFAQSEKLLILIPFEESLVRAAELATESAVILRTRVGSGASIALPKIPVQMAKAYFVDRGVDENEAQSLAVAAFRSIPLLRSRLRNEPSPEADSVAVALAGDSDLRRLWMLGAWSTERSGDREVVHQLLGHDSYQAATESLATNADPVFSHIGSSWKVIAPDLHLGVVTRQLTDADLSAFESAVQAVLGAINPTQDLSLADRWRASLYGPGKLHTADMRTGISTTLAAMGSGGELRIGARTTARGWSALIVRALLQRAFEDKSGQLWLSIIDQVPLLAEAAPDMFLEALERELDEDGPFKNRIFNESDEWMASNSPHVYVLWALETLAWSEDYLASATDLLARLVVLDPGGKMSNRPARSLTDIFRPWLPQTSASLEARLHVLRTVLERYP
jgi:hypothetical protein